MSKVIGMDLGDKRHVVVVFDESGNEERVDQVINTSTQVRKWFSRHPGAVVVMPSSLVSRPDWKASEGQSYRRCVLRFLES